MMHDFDLSPMVNPGFLSKSDFLRISLLKTNPLFLSFVPFFVREMLRMFKASIAIVSPSDLPQVQHLGNFLRVFPRLPRVGFIRQENSSFDPMHYKALTKSLNFVISQLPQSEQLLTDKLRSKQISDETPKKHPQAQVKTESMLALSLGQLASKKRRINLKLVIVGNSSTSLGILAHLLSIKDLIFNNIVLLSSEFKEQPKFLNVSPSEQCTEASSLKGMFLQSKIKMIQGEMISLDRKNKSIGIQDSSQSQFTLNYDYLVITTGLVDKTRDFLDQRDVFNNVFVMELEKADSTQNLNNLSSNTSANLSMNHPMNQSSQFLADKSRKISINGLSDHLVNQNFQTMLSYKPKNSPNVSSRNNFSNNSNVNQNDEDNLMFYSTQNRKMNTDFFVSVDDIQADVIRSVLAKEPLANPESLSKERLFSILEKERGWKGKLLHKKIPQNATLYGESPKIFALLESLLKDFEMDSSKISLLIPADQESLEMSQSNPRNTIPKSFPSGPLLKTKMSNLANINCDDNDRLLELFDAKVDSPETFENEELREFYLTILEFFGINVIRHSEILGLCEQENSILIRKVSDLVSTDQKTTNPNSRRRSSKKKSILPLDPLSHLESLEQQKNKTDSQFLNFVQLLRKFKYFFDFNFLAADVIEDILQNNPNLVSLLDDYNLEKRIQALLKSASEDENDKQNTSFAQLNHLMTAQRLAKKPFGLNTQVNEEGDDMIQDTIVFMGRTFDVSTCVFKAIQDNGLVFNGRLIVTNNFRTIDKHIYACGKISEFSKRYKNHALGRSLRVDKFDGFEVGAHFASQFVTLLRGNDFKEDADSEEIKRQIGLNYNIFSSRFDQKTNLPSASNPETMINKSSFGSKATSSRQVDTQKEKASNHSKSEENANKPKSKIDDFEKQIPTLTKPVSFKMRLFPGYYYLVIKKPYQGKADFNKKRYFETTNTLHRDVHYFMKISAQNIVNQIEKEKQLNLKIKNAKNVVSKKSSKKISKIFHYNTLTQKIEVLKQKKDNSKELKLEEMLESGVDNEFILKHLQEEEPSFGHYLLFEFDENHLVTKIEYMGRNEPHLEAFQNLFGLHRTFFHLMFERRDAGLLSDFVEFITQEWGNTLAHPKFSTFKLESMEIFRLMCQSHGHSKQTSCELFARVLQKIISNAHPEKLSKKGKDSKVDKHESNEKEKNDEDVQTDLNGQSSPTSKQDIKVFNTESKKSKNDSQKSRKDKDDKELKESLKEKDVNDKKKEEKGNKKSENKENIDLSKSETGEIQDKEKYKIFLKDEDIFIDIINNFDPIFLRKLKFIIDNTMKNYKDLFTQGEK